ncbi:MAG: uroporphyrinogen decarboxylase family protein [Candidatus Zipacnadales bacterium]
MTGRERALAALQFQPTDRVPLLGGFIAHADYLQRITGLDPWAEPRRTAIEAARAQGACLIIQVVTPKAAEHSTEMMGDRPTMFSRQEKCAFDSPEAVRDHCLSLPDPETVRRDFEAQAYYDYCVRTWRANEAEGGDDILILPYYLANDCPFMFYSQFGYLNYFQAIARYPEAIAKLFRHHAEYARLRNEVFVVASREAGIPPWVYMGQDICDNLGPMISLEALDRLYFPNLRYALEPLNVAGIRKIWHSDGNINPLIDRLIDCGIDGFQGLQEDRWLPPKQIVSLASLARRTAKTGDKLILFGSLSVRDVLPHGSPDDVRREVERCIDAAAAGGGYFLAPTSTLGPDVPIANIDAMVEHCHEYGAGR